MANSWWMPDGVYARVSIWRRLLWLPVTFLLVMLVGTVCVGTLDGLAWIYTHRLFILSCVLAWLRQGDHFDIALGTVVIVLAFGSAIQTFRGR